MELLSKITVKGVCGDVDIKSLHEGAKPVELCRVIGIVNSCRQVNNNFGDSVEFKGNFKGINLGTGEEFRAGKMYLPNIAAALLEGALSEDVESVQFAFDIGVKPVKDRQGKDSYQYTVKPLTEMGESDPLKMLESSISKIEDKSEEEVEHKHKGKK